MSLKRTTRNLLVSAKLLILPLALSVIAFLLVACGSGDKTKDGGTSATPTPTPGSAPVATVVNTSLAPETAPYKGGPRLYIRESEEDFGKVKIETNVDAIFHVQNVGDAPLTIKNSFLRVVEGCCPPAASLDKSILAPGEAGTLTAIFTMHEGMAYLHVFEVVVQSDDGIQPEQVVRLKADFVQ